MERFKDYGTVHGVGMAWFKEHENGEIQEIYVMAVSKSARTKESIWQGSRNTDGKVRKNRRQVSRNTDGKDKEIQMTRFFEHKWPGLSIPDGKVQEIQMARLKKIQMARLKKSK